MNEVGLILQPAAQKGEHQLFCYTTSKGRDKRKLISSMGKA